MTIEVRLHGAQGTRTQAVTPQGFPTRHINREEAIPSESVKVTPDLPTQPEPVSTPPAPRQQPVSTPEPVKPIVEYQHYDRFLIGVKATLKLSGKWQTPAGVFSLLYNKYNLANVHDVAVGLETLAKANEVESKETKIGMQYLLTTSALRGIAKPMPSFSKYHVAELTGIDEAKMCEYCKGVIISAADALVIADALDVQIEELDGLCEAPAPVKKQSLQSLLSEVDAILNKAVK